MNVFLSGFELWIPEQPDSIWSFHSPVGIHEGEIIDLPASVVATHELTFSRVLVNSVEHVFFDQNSSAYPYQAWIKLNCSPIDP